MTLESWYDKGHDPSQVRHYGPMAQEFLAAFGDDGFGTGGTDNTINGGGMAGTMMIAIQDPQERVLGMEERLKALEAR